ncbi:helix-turn-helix transcriptional regulator [Streptococcus sp. 2A/TPW/M5]
MVEDLRKFATLVKKYRKQKGMTKEELCQDESELTVRQLTRIESGLSRPTLTKINF